LRPEFTVEAQLWPANDENRVLQVAARFIIPDVLALKPANESKYVTSVELGQLTDGSVQVPFRLQLVPGLTGWRTVSAKLTEVVNNVTTVEVYATSASTNNITNYAARSIEEYVLQVGAPRRWLSASRPG
jgi:hypothetical protein